MSEEDKRIAELESTSAGSVSKKHRRITRYRRSEWPWVYPLPAIALTTNSKIEGDWCRFAFIVAIFRDTWIFKFGVNKQNANGDSCVK